MGFKWTALRPYRNNRIALHCFKCHGHSANTEEAEIYGIDMA
jgi:hypothetical protein